MVLKIAVTVLGGKETFAGTETVLGVGIIFCSLAD